MRGFFFTALASSTLALGACSAPTSDIARPEPRPLGREYAALSSPPPDLETAQAAGAGSAQARSPAPSEGASTPALSGESQGVLTLQQALALSLLGNPELVVFSYDTRAAEARTLQAGFRPNPELSLESEDFGGNRGRSGFQQAQTTLSLSQVVELGAKRAHRLRLARLEESLAAWDYETKRLDVFVEVTKAFITVLSGQRKVALAEATLRIEQQFYATVGERVLAGQVSPIEQRRADVILANGHMAIDKAKRDLSMARDKLAALWGVRRARFARVEGDLNNVAAPPPLDRLVTLAAQNPDLARWTTEIEQREARLAVERSKNVPDLTVNGGVRRYGDGGSAFVAGVGIPLPIFGLNRGNVMDAQTQLSKGLAQQRAAEIRIDTAVREIFEQLAGAYDEVTTLRRSVLPAAEATFNGTSIGYRDGKFGLLEVIDARRALTDAQSRLVDALSVYQAALADAERLTGQPLRDENSAPRTGGKR